MRGKRSRCDLIQYVTGFVLKNETHALLTYGIDDRRAAHVEVEVATILRMVDRGRTIRT